MYDIDVLRCVNWGFRPVPPVHLDLLYYYKELLRLTHALAMGRERSLSVRIRSIHRVYWLQDSDSLSENTVRVLQMIVHIRKRILK